MATVATAAPTPIAAPMTSPFEGPKPPVSSTGGMLQPARPNAVQQTKETKAMATIFRVRSLVIRSLQFAWDGIRISRKFLILFSIKDSGSARVYELGTLVY